MTHPFASEHYQKMALEARQLVRQWVNESQSIKPTFAAEQLAGVLKDPNGLPFTVGFVDGVIRPEDDNLLRGSCSSDNFFHQHIRRINTANNSNSLLVGHFIGNRNYQRRHI